MNKTFNIINRINNISKSADCIVKLSIDDKNYLIYSLDENEENKQILVSKLIVNSEGKNFIEEVSADEKNRLNNIVYNVVILMPANFKKGGNAEQLIKELKNKYAVTLSTEFPTLTEQEYYSSSSIAITNKTLVEEAISFYNNNLPNAESKNEEIPVWDIPMTNNHTEYSMETEDNFPFNTHNSYAIDETMPIEKSLSDKQEINNENLSLNILPSVDESERTEDTINDQISNPQTEKLAVISDSNLQKSIGLQPNVSKNYINNPKQAGFAKSKYIIIGTVCFILAILVVVLAIILIKNKQYISLPRF